jgi:hypothetical protein
MKKPITILSISLALINLTGCSNKTKEVCDCLKKAANTYMVQGEKPSDYELYKMCDQFDGTLKNSSVDDKRIIEQVMDTVKQHIEGKILFADVEDIKFPNIPCGDALQKDLDRFSDERITEQGKSKVMEYYLKNRNFECTMVVTGAIENTQVKSLMGELFDDVDDPKYYQVTDGNIYVNGYIYNNGVIYDNFLLTLMIPEKDGAKILSAVSAYNLDKSNNRVKDFTKNIFRQIIKFNATYSEIVQNGLGALRPVFNAVSYEFVAPNKETDKAEIDGHKCFLFEPYVPKKDKPYVSSDTTKSDGMAY